MDNQSPNQTGGNESSAGSPPDGAGQVINPGLGSVEPASTGGAALPPAPVTEPITASQMQQKFGGKKFGKAGIIAVVAVLLLGGSAAAYFGIVVPNKPENIWKAALSNTAKGYDKFVTYADENKDTKGVKASGNFKLEGKITGDAKLEASSYENNGKLNLDVGFANQRYGLEVLAIAADSSTTPDLYFKVDGLKSAAGMLGASSPGFAQVVASLDNQYVLLDHTFVDKAFSQVSDEQIKFTRQDIIDIAKAIGEVNHTNLLASDPDKAVFTVVEEVGKEERDNRGAYHFRVGIDKDNLKEYFEALKDKLANTKIKQLAGEKSFNQYFDNAIKALDEGEDFDENDVVDVWVDTKTKLIRYIKVTDEDNDKSYIELGLMYDGGDEYPFVINLNLEDPKTPSSDIDGAIKFTLNTDNDTVKTELELNMPENSKLTGELTIEPNNEPLNLEKPTNAKTVQEVISLLFFTGGVLGDNTDNVPSVNPLLNLPIVTQSTI